MKFQEASLPLLAIYGVVRWSDSITMMIDVSGILIIALEIFCGILF